MMQRKKKKLFLGVGVLGILAAFILIYVGIGLYRQRKDTEAQIAARYTTGADVQGDAADAEETQAPQETSVVVAETASEEEQHRFESMDVELNGQSYHRNTAIKAYLIMGVDRSGDMQETQVTGLGGQSDGVFLIAHNTADNTVKILQIPRDTMTPITLTDLSGNVLGKDIQHLTLAYAYGDGKQKSCEYMAEAVTTLLGGLQIDGYMSVNTEVISILNDLVGGVTVTIETDGLEAADPSFTLGNTVTLQGKQAERFVRYRDTAQDNTALTRMDRQRQYMKAFEETLLQASGQNSGLVAQMFDAIEPYMITNMQKGTYLRMAMDVLNSQQLADGDFYLLPGEAVLTNLYDEYHPNHEAIAEMVLELFYREQG